jgi:hypothetical protein
MDMTFDELSPSDSRFDALLRDMQAYGLVELGTVDGAPSWLLSDWTRARLEGLAMPLPSPDKLIFIGHRCAACGERRPTRTMSGSFVCDPCAAAKSSGEGRDDLAGADTAAAADTLAVVLDASEPRGNATSA